MRRKALIVIAAVIALDVAAFLLVPPFPKDHPGTAVGSIEDLIRANFEFPAPNVVWPSAHAGPTSMISFNVSITSTLFTMWVVMAVLLVVAFLATRRMTEVPGRVQNAIEWAWEGLENWATALGGRDATRHVPLFVAFFLFIIFSNWSGLLPWFGRVELFRAPTSDLNVTVGLALVAFVYYHFQGVRRLGLRGYLGKFFVFSGFRHGPMNGLIDLFVGLIEFLLEFIKPVTLSMRLFGNIYGGEVALGVITALTIALAPALMLLLEGLLNFVQALIFSTLMLMYTILALEGHHGDEDEDQHHVPAIAEVPAGAPAH